MPLNVLRGAFTESIVNTSDYVRICHSHGVPQVLRLPVSSDDFNKFVADAKAAACTVDQREFASNEPICFATASEICFLVTPDRLLRQPADVKAQRAVVESLLPQFFWHDSFLLICQRPYPKQIEPTLAYVVYPDDSEAGHVMTHIGNVKRPRYEGVDLGLNDEFTALRPIRRYVSRLMNFACALTVRERAILGPDDGLVLAAAGRV